MPEEGNQLEEILSETVAISKRHYEKLVADSEFLTALHACGVDNWEGYGDAVRVNELSGE